MINIICFGDSITEGLEFPVSARWTSLLQTKLNESKSGEFKVHNFGIGGNTTAQGFDRINSDVVPLLPGVVLIQFGLNDANVYDFNHIPRVSLDEFVRNMREFYRITIVLNGTGIFTVNHTIGNVDGDQGNGESYNANYMPYEHAIRNVARELDAQCIDLPVIMKERGIDLQNFLSDDQIHLSTHANEDYATMIFDSLDNQNLYNVL